MATNTTMGMLAIDPRTRLRLRFNGRGLLASEGVFLAASQVYGSCQKYIQKRRIVAESPAAAGSPLCSEASILDSARRSPSLRQDIEAHVAGCPRCVAFLESYRQTPGILRAATDADVPEEVAACPSAASWRSGGSGRSTRAARGREGWFIDLTV